MTIKNYADILRFTIKNQMHYIEEEINKTADNETFNYGMIEGLRIALDKIDASMFLAEK